MGKVVRNHASIMNVFAVTRMFVDPVGKSVYVCMVRENVWMDPVAMYVLKIDKKNTNYSSKDSNQGFTINGRYL